LMMDSPRAIIAVGRPIILRQQVGMKPRQTHHDRRRRAETQVRSAPEQRSNLSSIDVPAKDVPRKSMSRRARRKREERRDRLVDRLLLASLWTSVTTIIVGIPLGIIWRPALMLFALGCLLFAVAAWIMARPGPPSQRARLESQKATEYGSASIHTR
jgi:hypothetical protein